MPQGKTGGLIKLIGAGASRLAPTGARVVSGVKNAYPHAERAAGAGLLADTGLSAADVFTKGKYKWIGDLLHQMSPGTWVDATHNPSLINQKNKYERLVGNVSDMLDPWAIRDEYHSAYDTAGRNGMATDIAARIGDVGRNTATGLMYFPTTNPYAIGLMGGINSLNELVKYDNDKYNSPYSKYPADFKYMHSIPSTPDTPMSPEEMAHNKRAAEHNAHVNDWVDTSETAWKLAQSRARELADATSKIVADGHKMGLSTAQINARIKKFKASFGATGADVLRVGRSQASPEYYSSFPVLPKGYTNGNANDAMLRLGVNPIAYEYNAWNRR